MTAAAVEKKAANNSALAAAANLLKNWDGQMQATSPAALIALLNYQHLRRALADRASPGKGSDYSWQMGPAVVENLLRERPADWFADWDSTLVKAFEEAVGEARRKQGDDPAKWRYGVANTLELGHPVLSKIPYIGKYFQIGPVEMHGWTTTVKQTTPRIGPSMHFVADMSNWDASVNNIIVGQSGHAFSGHFKDQWNDYFAGRASPMPFTKVDPKHTLTLAPE
jgi:penicillin amidase